MIDSFMDGQPYKAARFAATFRRKLYREHLGLMPPQICQDDEDEVTSFIHCAPIPNEDETGLEEDAMVADPLSDDTQRLWNDTAKKNRDIFTEVFRPVPSNFVRSWSGYDVSASIQFGSFVSHEGEQAFVPKVKTGRVVPEIPLARVKDRLSLVKGALVECPLVRSAFILCGYSRSDICPTIRTF